MIATFFSSTPARRRALLLTAAALLAASCHRGRFVGSEYAPRKAYAGDAVPRGQLATVTPGRPVGVDGAARFMGIDDLRCEDDMGGCELVMQVPAGPHAFHLRVTNSTDWLKFQGGRTPVVTVESEVDLEGGVVYAVIPIVEPDGSGDGRVERLCASADPVATAKAYQLRENWLRTCRQDAGAPAAPAIRPPAR